MTDRQPTVAPFESCAGCYKGDTTTAFALQGSAEWIMVGLSKKIPALSVEEAQASVLRYCEEALNCDPGNVPTGTIVLTFRACRDCVDEDTELGDVKPGGEIPRYVQRS
jgi:hypothetical protein